MSKIAIASNLDYYWLQGRSFSDVIKPLIENGLSALEVHLDLRFPEISDHLEYLCKSAAQSGLGISFHAPYLEPPFLFGFSSHQRPQLEIAWTPVLDIVNRYASTNGIRTEMVLHGSHGPHASMDELLMDTVKMAQWILDYCPEIYLGIENLPVPRNPNELVKYGENRDSVLQAVEHVNHPRCGITWDMGHCVRNKVFSIPHDDWMNRVVHVHVHDVDENRQDHWPLILGSTPYESWIHALKKSRFCGTITAELNGKLFEHWTQEEKDQNLLLTIKKIKDAVELE